MMNYSEFSNNQENKKTYDIVESNVFLFILMCHKFRSILFTGYLCVILVQGKSQLT